MQRMNTSIICIIYGIYRKSNDVHACVVKKYRQDHRSHNEISV